ncbi:cingulin-like [Aplochiton taeniatus]
MSTQSSGRKTPVDHGVQIRFINDLHDGGGGPGAQPRAKPQAKPHAKPQAHSKYGVAVRVQGIAGQPYVVLKDGGEKGDSYGVQLRSDYPPAYSSLPRRREEQAGQEGDTAGGGGQGGGLRRAQSHGSLLERDDGGGGEGGRGSAGENFQLGRPPGDGRSGSYGNLDGGIGIRAEREQAGGAREGDPPRNAWRGSHPGLNGTLGRERASQSYPEPPALTEEPPAGHRHSPVNRIINRFQPRGPSPALEDPAYSSNTNPYSSPPSSTHSSLGRGQGARTEAPALPANQWAPPGRYGPKETVSANPTETRVRESQNRVY